MRCKIHTYMDQRVGLMLLPLCKIRSYKSRLNSSQRISHCLGLTFCRLI